MDRMTDYRTLGRTGLRVAPLGNLLDTADLYGGGESESWLGEFVEAAGCRDQVVIATKFSYNAQAGNPNAGGNGRKNIHRALEGSLRRLRTDSSSSRPCRA